MTLDFRSLRQPSIECIMLDDENTVIHVVPPTQNDVKRLETMNRELQAIRAKTPDAAMQKKMYDFLAELMSHNEEDLKITGIELKTKYRLSLTHLLAFEKAYIEFIAEIKSAKN